MNVNHVNHTLNESGEKYHVKINELCVNYLHVTFFLQGFILTFMNFFHWLLIANNGIFF